jgi:hypothetical protein
MVGHDICLLLYLTIGTIWMPGSERDIVILNHCCLRLTE